MANSLEVRVPFLDQHVIEHTLRYFPSTFKKGAHLKSFLKQFMQHYYPKAIISSSKKGFTVPIETWLRTTLYEDVNNVIFKTPIYGASQLDEDALKAYINGFYNGKHHSAWGVWHIYAWQKWAISEGHI
jgi:asparagine synthase (glutamine-hydrolysing)